MKKFFMLLAFAGLSAASMAQNDTELKYSVATNSFWSNWFVSADVAYEAFYSNEEKGRDYAKSPLKDFRRNLGASVAIGKWFTPGIGLRTKFTGIWGRNVISTDAETNAIKFWNLQEQVMFNLSNLFCGYNENRVWNLIPYAGVGVLRNCDMNEYCHGVSLGLLNTWKLSKHVALNFDLGFNLSDDDLRDGLANVIRNTHLMGRWQILNDDPLTIADTGHNVDGIREVISQLAEMSYNKLHFVLGMVNDKDIDHVLQLLPHHCEYYFCKADIPRGLDAKILAV